MDTDKLRVITPYLLSTHLKVRLLLLLIMSMITVDDLEGVNILKRYLDAEFKIKGPWRFEYFLSIEVLRSKKNIFMSIGDVSLISLKK